MLERRMTSIKSKTSPSKSWKAVVGASLSSFKERLFVGLHYVSSKQLPTSSKVSSPQRWGCVCLVPLNCKELEGIKI